MLDPFIKSLFATPAALLLIAAAAGALVSRYHLSINKPYLWRVLEAVASALLLLALAWVFGQGLNNISNALQVRQNRLEVDSGHVAQTLWGKPNQFHFLIQQAREKEVRKQIPRENKDLPPEWRAVKMQVHTDEYQIISFRGDINLHMGEREKDGKRYSGYLADVDMIYQIRNDAEADSEMWFELTGINYPNSQNQDVEIWIDNNAVIPNPESEFGQISWSAAMQAGQTSSLRIHYTTSGTNSFDFEIPDYSFINDNLLIMTIDQLPAAQVSALIVSAAPTEIRSSADGRGSVLTWKLNLTAPGERFGVRLPKAEPRGAQVLRALSAMPPAVSLLAGLLAVTMLLWQKRVDFIDLSFFLTIFALEFLVLSVLSNLPNGFWVGLALGLLLCLLMAWRWMVWRDKHKSSSGGLRWLLLGLFTVIALLVPLSSLWQRAEQQNAIQFYIQSGTVLLLTGLWLITRPKPERATPGIAEEEQVAGIKETTEQEAAENGLKRA